MSSPSTTTPALPPRSATANNTSTALWSVALAALVIMGISWLGGSSTTDTKTANTTNDPKSTTPSPATSTTTNNSNPPPTPDPEVAARHAREEEKKRLDEESSRAALNARLTQLKTEGESVAETLTQLERLASVWKTKYEPLRSDEVGQRIAVSPTHLVSAITALSRDRVSDKQRASWTTQLQQLLTPVELAAKSTAIPTVTDDTLGMVTKLHTTIRAAIKDWETDMAVLEAAKTATASLQPGPTLSVAWTQKLANERIDDLKAVEAVRQTAREEQTKRLAAAAKATVDAETLEKETQILVNKKEADHRRRQEELALLAAEEKRKRELAKAKLLIEYENDLPTIKTMLPAFITSGRTHRSKASNGPVSLTVIQSKGALEKNRNGMKEFCHMARQIGDRPQGPIPNFLGSEYDWQMLDKDTVGQAQDLIIKYGAIMVEKGLLDP
jgi:hypothetical protein